MAKKKSKGKRVTSKKFTRRSLLTKKPIRKKLQQVGADRRDFRPNREEREKYLKMLIKLNTIGRAKPSKKPKTYSVISDLKKIVCRGRRTRKQILFALGKGGKGGKQNRHKFTIRSKIKC